MEVAEEIQIDESQYLTVHVVASMLEKNPTTITRWCNRGKLDAVRVPSHGSRGGMEWRISRESVLRFLPQQQPQPAQQPETPPQHHREQRQATTAIETDAERDDINHAEAERLLKIEKYKKEKRQNELAEKGLIEFEKYRGDLDTIFSETWEFFREFVDKWIIRLNLDPETAKAFREDYEGRLRKFIERQKARALRDRNS